MTASKGVWKGFSAFEGARFGTDGESDDAVGLVKSVNEVDDKRSVTAEVAVAGMLEAWY